MECHIRDLDGPVEQLRIFAQVDWYQKLRDRLSFSRDDARSPEWADLLSRCTEGGGGGGSSSSSSGLVDFS